MDRRLTAYVLRYLLEHRFESKAEMARQLGMQQRTIEKVFENLDVAKAGTVKSCEERQPSAIARTTAAPTVPEEGSTFWSILSSRS